MINKNSTEDSSLAKWVKKVLREYAYRLLAARDYSTRDLEFKLIRRLTKIAAKVGIFEAERLVSEILVELVEKNFLNDLRFTENYVSNRIQSKGIKRIQLELVKKGIKKELIAKVLSESGGSQREVGEQLLLRKSKSWRETDQYKLKQKALGLLVRNGFEYEIARELVASWYKIKYNSAKIRDK